MALEVYCVNESLDTPSFCILLPKQCVALELPDESENGQNMLVFCDAEGTGGIFCIDEDIKSTLDPKTSSKLLTPENMIEKVDIGESAQVTDDTGNAQMTLIVRNVGEAIVSQAATN